MDIDKKDTAVVVTDPQNDFLSEKGVTWQLVGESFNENKTIEHIERIFNTAKNNGFEVFISPHYYYPTDDSWKFGGTLENMMHEINMFHRTGAFSLDGFSGSGADWLERYKPFIEDGKTVVASPHKVYGPENNDLILQQAQDQQGHFGRDVSQPVCRVAHARIDRTGFRGCRGEGRDGGCKASRTGRWLQVGTSDISPMPFFRRTRS